MNKNKEKTKNYQSGQIMIFVAFTIIVILGFAGLAIDGGRLYNDRRVTQGTTDTVAFTTALVIAQEVIGPPTNLSSATRAAAINAGIERALQNGYDNDNDPLKTVSISISNVPYYDDGTYYLVTVEIQSEILPTFIQLVYDGPLVNTGRAVVKARPRQNLAYGYTMYSADPSGCKGVEFGGTADVLIEGGGVFSNSTACDSSCNALVAGGSIIVDVPDGTIESAGCFELNGGATISPEPLNFSTQQEKPPITPPNCDDPIYIGDDVVGTPMVDYGNTYNNVHGTVELFPGRYDIIKNVGGSIYFHPGLYCIGSGDLSMSNGTIEGENVTLYLHSGASIKLTGGLVDLSAPEIDIYDSNEQPMNWRGMLIFMEGDGLVSLGGNGTMIYTGTVLALDPPAQANAAKCDVNGAGDSMGFNVQLICWSIRYTGGSNSYIKYYEPENFYYPATIDLTE